jgi:hypothetical protein
MPDRKHRPPISTRRAFAQAFDLALRRDPFHSLILPILLRAPWVLTLALLPPFETFSNPAPIFVLASIAMMGDFITSLMIGAMLRFRARSVFNTPRSTRPAPAPECYARGVRRIPWLLVTEVVRNFTLGIAASFSILPTAFLRMGLETFFQDLARNVLLLGVSIALIIPTLFLGFRLAVATESVVLDEHDLAGAFLRSFHVMEGHFERWFELIAASAALILGAALFSTSLTVLAPSITDRGGVATFWMLVIAVMPVIQYAWTFFYLRLVEIEGPGVEVGPTYASTARASGVAQKPLEVAGRAGAGSQTGDGKRV